MTIDNAHSAQDMRSLRLQLVNAKHQLEDGLKGVSNALLTLEKWEDGAHHHSDETAVEFESRTAIMRRRGGKGLPSKIDADPELRNFVRSHIYRLPYADIVKLVNKRFPKDRRTSASAISRWWSKQRPRKAGKG